MHGIATIEFAHLLGPWSLGEGPTYQRLADAIRQAIERGDLASGSRLPAERTLARALSLSRTTIVSALESLRTDGWIDSQQGSGSRVRGGRVAGMPAEETAPTFRRHPVYRGLIEGSGGTIEFLAAHLPAAGVTPDLLAFEPEVVEGLLRGPGYIPMGLPELRRSVAAHLAKSGLPTSPDQILITSGAQQAIALTAAALVSPGDRVVVENPTYLGAIDILTSRGARLVPVPVGREGVRIDALRDAARRQSPRLLYLMPTFQNPTGALMPEKERRIAARLSQETGIPILEDNTLADLSLGVEPPAPLAAFAPQAPILTVGSLSKLFWGGFRIGWIRASEEMLARIARLKIIADLGGSLLSQLAAVKLLARADKVKQIRRRQVRERFERLTGLLSRHLPDWTWLPPSGGLSLWVKLPEGAASEFAQVALRHGVSVVPGPLASPDGGFDDHLRLPYVLGSEQMEEGIRRLGRAWEVYAPSPRRARASLDVLV
ncbi:MAG TPA: PLP-dependent aminotransferase family protein [Thermoanaerobaculia bacterium]